MTWNQRQRKSSRTNPMVICAEFASGRVALEIGANKANLKSRQHAVGGNHDRRSNAPNEANFNLCRICGHLGQLRNWRERSQKVRGIRQHEVDKTHEFASRSSFCETNPTEKQSEVTKAFRTRFEFSIRAQLALNRLTRTAGTRRPQCKAVFAKTKPRPTSAPRETS